MFKYPQLIYLIFTCFWFPAAAQECRYRYTHYSVEDGLPNPMVYDIVQDRKGLIWMATESGLVRYNGYEFKTLTTEDGLPGNDVLRLFLDRQDRLWMVIYGQGIFYKEGNRYVKIKHPDLGGDAFVFTIDHHADSTTWIGTSRRGLFIYRDSILLEHHMRFGELDTTFRQFTTTTDARDSTWVMSSIRYGCCGMEPEQQFQVDQQYKSEIYDPYVTVCLGAKMGVGIVTQRYLMRHTPAGVKLIFPSQTTTRYNILGVDTLSNGGTIVSTNLGAFELQLRENDSVLIKPLITGEPISGVFEDSEGNLWMSTLNNGIYFINRGARLVEEILDENIQCIIRYQDKVITGSKDSRIFVLSDTTLTFTLPDIERTLTPAVNDFVVDESLGVTYLATDKYVMMYSGNWTDLKPEDYQIYYRTKLSDHLRPKLKGDTTYSYYAAFGSAKRMLKYGDSLLLASNNGLFLFYKSDTTLGSKVLDVARLIDVGIDSSGQIWAVKLDGLYRFADSLTVHISSDSLFNYINVIQTPDIGIVWMGTNGAGVYIKMGHHLRRIKLGNTVSANIINDLAVYPAQNLALAATNYGVMVIKYSPDYSNIDVAPWSFNSGLPSLVVNTTYLDNDMLYVATARGLVRAPFSFEASAKTSLPLIIEDVWINDNPVLLQDHYKLSYLENSIGISFAGLSYSSERNITYQYKIEEIDTAWNTTGTNQVQFSSLSPGKYTFSIRAKGLDGLWHDEVKSLHFHIVPPYWQTTWFMLLMLGGIVLIIVVLAIGYVRYNRNRDRIARKLVELEGQALRAQMNPHFIFNSLNAVHDFIADNDKRSAHLYLSRFAKLIRRILDHSRRALVTFEEEVDTLVLYIQLEQMRFEGKFDYEMVIDNKLEMDTLKVPPMVIQPYVENAIRHGLMNRTDGKGLLSIRIFTEHNELVCVIEDNGVGRKASAEVNLKHGTEHKSYAMKITNERLTQLNTLGKDKGRVKVSDLLDENGKGLGTRVTVWFYMNDAD